MRITHAKVGNRAGTKSIFNAALRHLIITKGGDCRLILSRSQCESVSSRWSPLSWQATDCWPGRSSCHFRETRWRETLFAWYSLTYGYGNQGAGTARWHAPRCSGHCQYQRLAHNVRLLPTANQQMTDAELAPLPPAPAAAGGALTLGGSKIIAGIYK